MKLSRRNDKKRFTKKKLKKLKSREELKNKRKRKF